MSDVDFQVWLGTLVRIRLQLLGFKPLAVLALTALLGPPWLHSLSRLFLINLLSVARYLVSPTASVSGVGSPRMWGAAGSRRGDS